MYNHMFALSHGMNGNCCMQMIRCHDFYNINIFFIEKFPERIKHVHLHDNRGGNSHTDDLHLPPGEGVIDFQGLFEALRLIHYDRTVTLELKPHEIRKCLAYVSELVSGRPHGRTAC